MSFKTGHKIINGDSRQMTELEDKSVDLAFNYKNKEKFIKYFKEIV